MEILDVLKAHTKCTQRDNFILSFINFVLILHNFGSLFETEFIKAYFVPKKKFYFQLSELSWSKLPK